MDCARWRGRVGTLKELSESGPEDAARETGVGLRTVNDTFCGAAMSLQTQGFNKARRCDFFDYVIFPLSQKRVKVGCPDAE